MTIMERHELTEMERMVRDAVEEIQSIKRDNGQHPDSATRDEIFNSFKAELMEALRSLYRKGLITFHQTVNGIPMFGIKEE